MQQTLDTVRTTGTSPTPATDFAHQPSPEPHQAGTVHRGETGRFDGPAPRNDNPRTGDADGRAVLQVAFDVPTQAGYDPDHELARGTVGQGGASISHLGDMRRLFDGVPLEATHTSMPGNAMAMWTLALYQVVAEERGADATELRGSTRDDGGTYVFPPEPSVRLTTDLLAYTVDSMPNWHPVPRDESGATQTVGATAGHGREPGPHNADLGTAVQNTVRDVDPTAEVRVAEAAGRWRATRDEPFWRGGAGDPALYPSAVQALEMLKEAAAGDTNLMEPTLECARAGVTTGEWAGALREVFGEFAPQPQ